MPGNPRLAFVELRVDDKVFSVPPDLVTEFSYVEKNANGGNSFSLSLFDRTGDILEDLLDKNVVSTSKIKGAISFRWGFDGEMSTFRHMTILSARPSTIDRGGIGFQIEGVDTATGKPEANVALSKTFKNIKIIDGKKVPNLISDIVKEIAKKHGWKTDVEPTACVEETNSREETGKKPKIYQQDNKSDLQFLNELAVVARSAEKPTGGRYRVFFDDKNVNLSTKEPQPVLHFHTTRAPEKKLIRLYEVQTDRLGDVRSYDPEIQDTALHAAGASAIKLVSRDRNKRKSKVVETSADTFKDSPSPNKFVGVKPGNKKKIFVPSMEEKEQTHFLANVYDIIQKQIVKAELTINGDPTMVPGRYVKVVVRTNTGKIFFTTRDYEIFEVEHKITPGDYETKMLLFTAGANQGDIPSKQVKPSVVDRKPEK